MSGAPEVIAAAVQYMERGYAIVAARPNKSPWGDEADGKNWRRPFSKQEIIDRLNGRLCNSIGFLGGDLNNHIVPLDFDTEAGEAWWQSQCEAAGIPPDDFPTVITPGKVKDGKRTPGRHRYVSDIRGTLGNWEGKLRQHGINIRGNGHAMLPPSPHPDGGTYRWLDRHSLDDFETIPACPDFVYEAINARPHKAETQSTNGGGAPHDGAIGNRETAYARAALDAEARAVATAQSGSRNESLNVSAFKLGRMTAAGWIGRAEVESALLAASHRCGLCSDDGEAAAKATIASGIKAGMAEPQDPLPDREPPRGNGDGRTHADDPAHANQGVEFCLSVDDWLSRDIPAPDFLLGELLSTTTRMLLVAPTGLGKTNVAMALSFSLASGHDFLHWRTVRPARVLFVDGEMSRRLMRVRLTDAARRLGLVPETLFVLSRDDLPAMPPLNTPEGQQFVDGVIHQIGGIDFAIFDNVQSLTVGDMKDEESWQQTLPWIKSLTQRSIGQISIHHTGHDQSRSYGTSTREWQLDTVALMEAIDRPGTDIASSLKFTKARERNPHNRADFEPVVITLSKDEWGVEVAEIAVAAKTGKKPSPKGLSFHNALIAALATCGSIRSKSSNRPSVTMAEWQGECLRQGLLDGDAALNQTRALFSKYKLELVSLKWVVCNGNIAWKGTVAK